MNYFFTSDLHLGHKNVISYDNRPFKDIEEHDEALINNWNSVVGIDDVVYFLGDIALCNPSKAMYYVHRLNGTIHWILGNHDSSSLVKHLKCRMSSVQEYLDVTVEDTRLVLFHYPIGSWRGVHRGVIHLHGHCHGSYKHSRGKMMDVGTNCTKYTPISLEAVKAIMNKKDIYSSDHHGQEYVD